MELFVLNTVTYLGASKKTASLTNDKNSANLNDGKLISSCAAGPDGLSFVPLVL